MTNYCAYLEVKVLSYDSVDSFYLCVSLVINILYINYNILYYQYVFNPTQCIHDYLPQELCFENEGTQAGSLIHIKG